MLTPSGTNFYCCAVRLHAPEFLDLFVGQRDATHSPILLTMKSANPTQSVSIGFDPLAVAKDRQSLCRFFDDDPIDCCSG
jgi:hypothetical protein